MDLKKYNEKFNSLASLLLDKAKRLDAILQIPAEQVSIDSQSFEKYGLLPDFEKIYNKEYIDSLFLLRKFIGKDILVSDLIKLGESKKNGILDSYIKDIEQESRNSLVYNSSSNFIDYFLTVRNEINKFYISDERITFFSGASFYFERTDEKFYSFSKLNEKEVKLGELILSNISEEERKIKLKSSNN